MPLIEVQAGYKDVIPYLKAWEALVNSTVYIGSNGRIGIFTDEPQAKVHVRGRVIADPQEFIHEDNGNVPRAVFGTFINPNDGFGLSQGIHIAARHNEVLPGDGTVAGWITSYFSTDNMNGRGNGIGLWTNDSVLTLVSVAEGGSVTPGRVYEIECGTDIDTIDDPFGPIGGGLARLNHVEFVTIGGSLFKPTSVWGHWAADTDGANWPKLLGYLSRVDRGLYFHKRADDEIDPFSNGMIYCDSPAAFLIKSAAGRVLDDGIDLSLAIIPGKAFASPGFLVDGDGNTHVETVVFPDASVQTTAATGGTEALLTTFTDFATAISSIGSTATTLVIDELGTVASNVTIPATIVMRRTGTGKLTVNTGVTLTIADGNSLVAVGPEQIFALSGTGTVRFTKHPQKIYPEWWGAKGDDTSPDIGGHSGGATDNLAAFNAMMDSISANNDFEFASAKIELSLNRTYYLSDTFHIRTAVDMGCESGHGWSPGAYIRGPANKTKILVHALSTYTGLTTGGDDARWTRLHNFGVVGEEVPGSTTHTVDISGLTLTKTAGASFTDALGYHDHNTITVNGFAYAINAYISATQISLRKPRLYVRLTNGSTTMTHEAASVGNFPTGTNDWNGSTFVVNGTTYTISTLTTTGGSFGAGTATISPAFAGTTGVYTVALSGASVTGGAARPNLYHGIDARGHVQIENMYLKWNDGNGINLDSSMLPTSFPGGIPNNNNSKLAGNYCYYNRGNGILMRGVNSNQSNVQNTDSTLNHGAGVAEFSFLGNNYFSNHTSGNGRGAVVGVTGGVNVSNFWSDYSEGGQPSEIYGQSMMVCGGNHGAGISTTESDTDFKRVLGGTGANGLRDAFLFASGDVATGNIGGPVRLLTMPGDTNYSITTADRHLVVSGTLGNINYPAAASHTGREYTVTSLCSGVVSLFASSGSLDVSSLPASGDHVTLYSDGTNWKVKAQSVGASTFILPIYANNAAAIAGGLAVGRLYRSGADPDLVAIVHNPPLTGTGSYTLP